MVAPSDPQALEDPNPDGDDRAVQVAFRITPPEPCLVRRLDRRIRDIRLFRSDESINCDIVVGEEDGDGWTVVQGRWPVETACPCVVFSDLGVVPQVMTVNDDSFDVTLFADSPSVARQVFAGLDAASAQVELLRFLLLPDRRCDPSCRVDLTAMTEKQRRTLELAFEEGYYDRPRQADLETLAEAFDISPSAVASRLRTAERHVFQQLFEDGG